jgi:hypothetical protein
MADETTAARIMSLEWRQGSVLGPVLVDEAIKLKPERVGFSADNLLIVTSHDCDIANESLQKEPVVEVLCASTCKTSPNGNFQCGRNPRSLDLVWETGEKEIGLRLNIHDRWVIPRELLSKEAPRPGLKGKPLRVVVEWLAKRYYRAAFPTAFDGRWKGKSKVWDSLLKKNSEWIQGVYLRLSTLDELSGNQPYRCHLMVAIPAPKRKGPEWARTMERLTNEIENFWQQFEPGILCDGVEVLGTDEITLSTIEPYQRFDADWVSFSDDSPSMPATSDMKT